MVAVLQRRKWAPALAAVLLGCLAPPARAQELQYLPDGTDLVFAVNVATALKCKTSEALWGMFMKGDEFTQLEKIYKDQGKELTAENLVNSMSMVPVANLARYTVAVKHGDEFKSAKAQTARAQMSALTQASQAYFIKNTEWPQSLADLLKKDGTGTGPYLENEDALLDPWKKPYQYDPAGKKNNGTKPDIWTVTPDKVVIGNWPAAKNEKEDTGAFVIIYTTIKPVTPAEIKAGSPLLLATANKEVKVGLHTMYEDLGKTAFCVVEGKYVLYGRTKELKAILERTKKPEIAPGLQAALDKVGSKSTISVAVSLQALPAAFKKELPGNLGMPAGALDATLDSMQSLTVQASEAGGNLKLSATLICKDAAGAAELKKAVEAGLTAARGKLDGLLKNLKPDSAEEMQLLKETRTLLDAVKVSTKGARVAAEVSASPASAARVTWAFFATRPGGGPKKEPEVKKTTGKSSTDSK